MSATLAVEARRPSVRVGPAPRSEPPTDDELLAAGVHAVPMTAPALPLVMPTQRRRTAARRVSPVASRGDDPDPDATSQGRPDGLTPARLATRRFLAVCVEVMGGFRPVAQLRSLCLPERYDEIVKRLRAHTPGTGGTGHGPVARRTPTGAPPRPGRAGQSAADRVAVRRVQVCEAVDGVVEVAAVLARRDHVWAIALRLERRGDRWLCAHLEVI
jgi:hypothetical protein